MIQDRSFDLNFHCLPGLFFIRRTLPAKIIQLRKSSQEKHINRMKIAYQKKESLGLMDISSYLPPYFPQIRFSNSKSPLTIRARVQSPTGNIKLRRRDRSELLPAKAKSNCTRSVKYPDSYYRSYDKNSVKMNKIPNRTPNNIKKSSLSKGEDCHINNITVIKNKDCLHTKIQKEGKIPLSAEEKFSSDYKSENNRENEELPPDKSTVTSEEQKDIGLEKRSQTLISKRRPSKIPILKSRLKMKYKRNRKYSNKQENSTEADHELPQSMLNDIENEMSELNLQATGEEENDTNEEESYILPSYQYDEEDSYLNIDQSFYEESPEEIPLIDQQMNDIESENNSWESLISKLKNVTALPSQEKSHMREANTPENLSITKSCEMSDKYDYVTDMNESEYSPESFYETENVDDGRRKTKGDDLNELKNTNFETDSTITVPSDSDLEIAGHRDPVYKNLPDYPNTPYNLRYPRYKFNRSSNIFCSDGTESPESSTRIKSFNMRKKAYSAIPKRMKSGKKRKPKIRILRKKEA